MAGSREIYMRSPEDPNYKKNLLEVSDEIEMLITQIKMILLTDQGDILGAPDFGMSLETLLFTFDANAFSIEQKLKSQMLKFCPLANRYDVRFEVKFFKGTVQDIGLIDVFIGDHMAFGVSVV
jgi:phage baseplate assembly protein W